ncbi:MFS transporter [Marinilactibacillus sp. XAAS-LB27]|uniref:MFS transporter n=1 Tax=Marinilactibacillus sp. XAAS-LB27 TaxID=3114538 RepID=UPI002E18977B|nr:MFS transporter [Marinilactibacillus sp. XAAS-LB27]
MEKTNRTITALLTSVGLSNIGEWIYFIALNMIILSNGGNAFSVGLLYIIRPIADLLTNISFNAYIDQLHKKKWMVLLSFFRAFLVGILILNQELWIIYMVVFFIQACSSIYDPLSLGFVKLAIPKDKIKKFNSWKSVVSSGGFLIGPAIAGILLSVGTPLIAIIVNVVALFLAGVIQLSLPDYSGRRVKELNKRSLLLDNKKALLYLKDFYKNHHRMVYLYFFISSLTVLAAGLDSVEAAFSINVLMMSEQEYGLLVSIAGAGFVTGAILNSFIVEKLTIKQMIIFGSIVYVSGYLVFSTSSGFEVARIGFFLLSFALAFINTGFLTFIQIVFPENRIGQLTTAFNTINSVLQMIVVAAVSGLGSFISIRLVLIATELFMVGIVFLIIRHSNIMEVDHPVIVKE